MLQLKTAAGERLEIPAACIMAVMKPCDGVNPCAIIYDFGAGAQVDQLADQYGFVRKAVIDAMAMINAVEIRIVEPVSLDGVEGWREGRMFLSRQRILGRREVRDDPNGVRARLYADLFNIAGKATTLNIADTLDEMDGVESSTFQVVATDRLAGPEVSRET